MVEMKRSPNAIPCGICGSHFFPWTVEVEVAFKALPGFPGDRYYFMICKECKEADRSPAAKHKQIPELCDFVWETMVLGDAYTSRPTLSMEAFTAVGIPQEWVQMCLDSRREKRSGKRGNGTQ